MRRLFTPAWLTRHALAAVLVVSFLWLGWWQINRAASGNALSWAYAVEWPIFAGFVVFVWWREIRRDRATPTDPTPPAPAPAGVSPPRTGGTDTTGVRRPVLTRRRATTDRRNTNGYGPAVNDTENDQDTELAAYNDYLAWLTANPTARPSDYPG